MCGICGILGPGGKSAEKRATLRSMMDALRHRGPDGEGTAFGSNWALGHTRLAIIDIEHGKQPMHSPDDRYTLVFNGEIYNYIELRESLVQKGIRFRTASDTEVLLQLLIREGEKALEKLQGMFAFCFYDHHTGNWLLARDPFGIKPLYYSTLKNEIVFASEIKALLKHPAIRPETNWNALQQYLTFQLTLGDQTLFRDIKKLDTGCYVIGSQGKVLREARYWDTNYAVDEQHTESYFTEQLSSLLNDSVRIQLRSDVPLGTYLSGGMDSSVISTLAARQLNNPMKAFHGYFPQGPEYDESSYAKLVAKHIGAEIITIPITAQEFVDDLPHLIYAMDEPAAGPGLFPQYRVSQLAAQHVKVVLGGQGGDEIFGGYARYLIGYLEQCLKGAIFETQEEGRHLVTMASIIPNLPILQNYTPLMKHFWKDGLFAPMDERYFRLIDRSPDMENLLTPEARQRIDHDAVFADFQKIFNHPDTKSYFNKMTHFDQKTLLPALLQVEDRVSMAVSLESRVPFLDTRVVDLVTTMPPPMKFRDGRMKNVLKEAVGNLLPERVLNRKDKMGFPVPLNEWILKPPVRDFVKGILTDRRCRERGIFSPSAVENLMRSEKKFGRQLWGVLCLELWYRKFIDAKE